LGCFLLVARAPERSFARRQSFFDELGLDASAQECFAIDE